MEYPQTFTSPTYFWRRRQALFSEIIFVGVVAIWGITFVFSRNALEVVGPFAYNTIRLTLGAVTLAILAGRYWQNVGRRYLWPSLLTGLILFLSYAVQAYGQQFTTASKAGFLTGTNIVYVPILSAVLLRRAPGYSAVMGVISAFIGLFLLSVEANSLSFIPGDVWVALSGVGWAFYIIVLTYYSPRLEVMTYASLHVWVAALMSGLSWLLVEPLAVPVTSSALWIGVVTTGFLIIGLGTSVQTWVTRLASPTRVALIAVLEPVFAAVAGWWVGEAMTMRIVTGGMLIIIGMLIAEVGHLLKAK